MTNFLRYPLEYYGNKIAVLGEGSFGEVYAYQNTQGKKVAVKIFSNSFDNTFVVEASILLTINDINVVNAIDAGIIGERFYIVMELAIDDIRMIFRDLPYYEDYKLNSLEKKKALYQIAKGLAYLNARNIIHGDVKPQNILFYENNIVKIADLGIAIPNYCNIEAEKSLQTYTSNYRAPEIILGDENYTIKADVWALGCTFYELMTLTEAFSYKDETYLMIKIMEQLGPINEMQWPKIRSLGKFNDRYLLFRKKSNPRFYEKITDPQLKDLLSKMFIYNPEKRISIFEVLEHPYFQEIHSGDNIYPLSCKQILDEIKPEINVYQDLNIRIKRFTTILDKIYRFDGKVMELFQCLVFYDIIIQEMFNEGEINDENTDGDIAKVIPFCAFAQNGMSSAVEDYTKKTFPLEKVVTSLQKCFNYLGYNCYRSTPFSYYAPDAQPSNLAQNKDDNIWTLFFFYILLPDILSWEEMAYYVHQSKNSQNTTEREFIRELITEKWDAITNVKGKRNFQNVYEGLIKFLQLSSSSTS